VGATGGAAPGSTAIRRSLRIWPWVVVLCVGLALGAFGGGVFAVKSVRTLLGIVDDARLTPVTLTVHCETGTYLVFEEGTTAQSQTVLPSDVAVTGPGGERIQTTFPSTFETRSIGGRFFQNVVSFATPVAGTYRVAIVAPGQHVAVVVAPSLGTTVQHNLVWLVVGLLGIVPFLLGVTMVIVRTVQRSRRRARAPSPPRCANGHPASPADKFCASCGAPVYPSGTMATYLQ
jgi:hypothetical protein